MSEISDKIERCTNCGKELHNFEGMLVHGSAAMYERCQKIMKVKSEVKPLLPKVMELIESPEFMEQLKAKGYQVDAVALLALTVEAMTPEVKKADKKQTIH